MKTARALTVLVVACIIGAGLGLTAHAVTADDTSTQAQRRPAAPTVTSTDASTTPTPTRQASSASPTTRVSTSASTSAGSQTQLSLRNLFTTADLRAANFQVAKGRYTQGDANEFQYALTPCMRRSLGQLTGTNAYAADAYGDENTLVNEAVSAMVTEAQARTTARTLATWHTGRCPNGPTFTADESRTITGGTVQTFLSDQGDVVAVIRARDRLAVVRTSMEPSASTTQNVIDVAVRRLTTPAR